MNILKSSDSEADHIMSVTHTELNDGRADEQKEQGTIPSS